METALVMIIGEEGSPKVSFFQATKPSRIKMLGCLSINVWFSGQHRDIFKMNIDVGQS